MQVFVRHTYYPGPACECPDFEVIPTPDSRDLMNDLGLQLLEEPYGFSILYDSNRKEDLLSYLRRQADQGAIPPPKEKEVWTRISVALALKNKSFINFTRIPIDTDPALENFYFSNQEAHRVGESVMLSLGKSVHGNELLKVIPPQYAVPVGPDVACVRVLDVTLHPVICRPRCIPRGLAGKQNPNTVTCQDVQEFKEGLQSGVPEGLPDSVCVNTIFLDFSQLPEGKYSIQKVRSDGTVICHEHEDVLYTVPCAAPLCFIDLFLTDPMPEISENGIYPVQALFDPDHTKIVEVGYELKFLARSTFWNYFIVPQPERPLALSITGPGAEFFGPCPVVLSNGARAYRFLSRKPIRLQQYSKASFELWSKDKLLETLIEKRLPVASTQVLPRNDWVACRDLLASVQKGAERLPPCRELMDHLCPDCNGLSLRECAEKVKALLRKPNGNSSSEVSIPPGRNYSDIFVYV